MATKTFKGRIQNKHDTEANWNAAVNFKPLAGELIIYDEDNTHSTPRFKVGDGSTLVSDLPFVNGSMKFDTDSFSYEDYGGNIGTFGPTSIGLEDSTYKAVYDTTSIGYKNTSTDVAYDLKFPTKSGTLALTSDIPDTSSFVTISGAQTISGKKTFTGTNTFQGSTTFLTASAGINDPRTYVAADGVSCATASGLSTHYMYGKIANRTNTLTLPLKTGTVALTSDIDVTAAGDNTFTGMTNTFTNQVNLQGLVRIGKGNSLTALSSTSTTLINVNLPSKTGTLAITDDIDVTAAGNNTFTGSNTFKALTLFEDYIQFSKTPIVTNDILGIGKNGIRAIGRMNTEIQTIKFPDFSNFGATTHTIPLNDTDNTFTGTNTFKTETSGNLYRTLIDQNGISVGGGPGSIVLDITYGFDNIKRLYGDTTYTYTFPNKNGIFATMNDIPNVASLAKLAQDNTFTGSNTFNNGGFKVNSSYGIEALSIDPLNSSGTDHTGMTTLKSAIDQYWSIELGAGSLSISSKGTNNNTGHINISTGANGVDFNIAGVTSAFKVLSDGIKVNSKTKYCGGKIDNIVSGTTYSLTLPSESGTLALTNDIPIKTATLSGTTLSITLS